MTKPLPDLTADQWAECIEGLKRSTRLGGPQGAPLEDVGGPLLQPRVISLPGGNLVGTVRTATCRGKEVDPPTRHPRRQ